MSGNFRLSSDEFRIVICVRKSQGTRGNFAMFTIESAGATDRGRRRRDNQDRFYAGGNLFAVADGVGGHPGGDIAAQTAIDVLWSLSRQEQNFDLARAVRIANIEINTMGRDDPDLRTLATTITAIQIINGELHTRVRIANIGDSRLYLVREGAVTQLTRDDTVTRVLQTSCGRRPTRILTRALGLEPTVDVQISNMRLLENDRLLLCTDGISNELSATEIRHLTSDAAAPREVADRLVWAALAAGGRDNATVVVIDVTAQDPAQRRGDNAGPSRRRLLAA